MKRRFTLLLLLTFTLAVLPSCSRDDYEDPTTIPVKVVEPIVKVGCDSLIAHRGCWGGEDFPQNSLAAFRKALTLNIYGTEFDVRQTRDGRFVINHDATFKNISIADSDYDYLCNEKLSNGETIPLFEDFITAYEEANSDVLMIVELKSCNVDQLVALLEQHDLMRHVLFISFNKKYCNKLVKLGYGPITCYLRGDVSPQDAHQAGYGGLDYPDSSFVSHPEWIDEAKALGLWVGVWTVNDKTRIQEYESKGVIVTTDKAINEVKVY